MPELIQDDQEYLALKGSYHGLSYGALSITHAGNFRENVGPFLEDVDFVPINKLEALENQLKKEDVAALIVEPVQGKGVHSSNELYYPRAQELCHQYGTLFICDEVQTGLGRTGKLFGLSALEP